MEIKKVLKENENLMAFFAFMYSLLFGNIRCFLFQNSVFRIRGAFLRKNSFQIEGHSNKIIIGKRARINNCSFTILGNNCKIIIGGGSTIIDDTEFWCQDDNSTIIIGRDFTMGGGHIASTEGMSIIIGDDCMFSNDIEIRNGDSHSIIDTLTLKRINLAKSVNIGNHVWLTAHVRVLKGSNIPDNCIIGNSSVVTSKFNRSNSLYSGVPCGLIKENIDWDRNKI